MYKASAKQLPLTEEMKRITEKIAIYTVGSNHKVKGGNKV